MHPFAAHLQQYPGTLSLHRVSELLLYIYIYMLSATEPKPKLLRYKNIIYIVTFKVSTLNTMNELVELSVSVA